MLGQILEALRAALSLATFQRSAGEGARQPRPAAERKPAVPGAAPPPAP